MADSKVVVRRYDDSALAFHVDSAETHLISLPAAELLQALAAQDLSREEAGRILCGTSREHRSAEDGVVTSAGPERLEVDETIAQLAALGLLQDRPVAPR